MRRRSLVLLAELQVRGGKGRRVPRPQVTLHCLFVAGGTTAATVVVVLGFALDHTCYKFFVAGVCASGVLTWLLVFYPFSDTHTLIID